MANPTSNFNWQMPTASDLVTDLPADFEVFGQAVDTSLADLKGGTTDQVLAKNSNTDMDFKWVTSDDANAIQNSIVDAKGDLIAASANDTPARLAVGNNGETLVADSSATTGLRWQGDYAAGKNKLINGDFGIWQRGTTFTDPAGGSYLADRMRYSTSTAAAGSITISQQTFTPGTAPVAGYEAQYFLRSVLTTVGSATAIFFTNMVEDVRTLAGQTATFSFWAKSDSNRTQPAPTIEQQFGSGGSSAVDTTLTSFNTTTSWQRFSFTLTLPSISGKTIGTGNHLRVRILQNLTSGNTLDIWGEQLEAGSVATAFQTATGTLQGELAACQRYYQQYAGGLGVPYNGVANSATTLMTYLAIQPTMRTAATCTVGGTLYADDGYSSTVNAASPTVDFVDQYQGGGRFRIGGFSGMTTGRHYSFYYNTGYIGLSAEL
jgi:hypothetical protein